MNSDIMENNEDILLWTEKMIQNNIKDVIKVIESKVGVDNSKEIFFIKLAMEQCVKFVRRTELEILLNCVCPALSNTFNNTLLGISSLEDMKTLSQTQFNAVDTCKDVIGVCSELICSLIQTFEILSLENDLELVNLKDLLFCAVSVLQASFQHYYKGSKTYGPLYIILKENLQELFCKTCTLNTLLMNFSIKLSVKLFCCDSEGFMIDFVEVLSQLAVLALDMDVKILAETWKCLISFIDKYRESCKTKVDAAVVIPPICLKIRIDLMDLLTIRSEEINALAKNIKVLGFLLKILIKLLGIFDGYSDIICKEVASLLILLYRFTPSHLLSLGLSHDIVSEVTRQLVIGADPLLSAALNNHRFNSSLLVSVKQNQQDNPYGCLVFHIALLKKLENPHIRLTFSFKTEVLLENVFLLLNSCDGGILNDTFDAPGTVTIGQPIVDADLYQFTLKGTAIFVLATDPSEYSNVENVLLENVLQTNPFRALLATDLWCLVVRFAEPDVCHNTLNALLPILEHINLGSNRPEFCFLLSLVKRLLPLCEPAYLDSLWNKYCAIGDDYALSYLTPLQKQHHTLCVQKLKGLIIAFNDCHNENHQDIQYLETYLGGLIAKSKDELSSLEIFDLLDDLWSLELPNHSSAWFQRNTFALCQTTSSCIAKMPPQCILKILGRCREILKMTDSYLKIGVLKIISSLRSIPSGPLLESIVNDVSLLWQTLLDSSNTMIREICFSEFALYAQETSHPVVISCVVAGSDKLTRDLTDYLKKTLPTKAENVKIAVSEFEHVCTEETSFEDENPIVKRRKTIPVEGGENVGETLVALKNATSKLAALSKEISCHERCQLNEIIQQLSRI